jgi:hypothetical protein
MNEIIKKNGITYGVISGIVSVLITTIMYSVNLDLFINLWIGFGLLFFFLAIGIIQLINTKKELKGQMTFKQGFTTYFLASLIGILISTAFSIVLFNLVDTEARDKITELLIDFKVGMMKKYNSPASEINIAIKDMKENPQFTITGQLFGIAKSLSGAAIFGLILAAIFKTKTPEQL